MTPEHYVWIWLAGTAICAVLVGVIARHSEQDRSWSVFAALWPALLPMALIVGAFYLLAELGGWIGRQLPPKTIT